MLALLPTLGFQEMVVILVLGIVLFGRNLPDVGRKLGRTVAQLRRGMQEFKDQMGRDESIRELRDSVKQTRDQIARAGTVPRALANPGGALRDLARETMTAPDAQPDEAPGVSAPLSTDGPATDVDASDTERADGEHGAKQGPVTGPSHASGDQAT